jgi:F420-non-reducing hydrogenase small subunit
MPARRSLKSNEERILMKVATYQLTSCCGCHIALVNLGTQVLDLLSAGQLVFSPVLKDVKEIEACDVAIIEGSVRNEENLDVLSEIRNQADTLIAFGICACFGGVPGLGSAFQVLEIITEVYDIDFTPENIPGLTQRLSPIDSYVEVDYYLPGCPPPPDLLKNSIEKLLTGQDPPRYDLPVCADCDRVVKKKLDATINRTANSFPDDEECLLSQGYICLGSVSRSGCGAPCPHAGVPCMGCRGPIDRVFTEPTHGIFHDLTRRLSHFSGKPEEEVITNLKDLLHTLYIFTLSVPDLRQKDTDEVSNLIARIRV